MLVFQLLKEELREYNFVWDSDLKLTLTNDLVLLKDPQGRQLWVFVIRVVLLLIFKLTSLFLLQIL